MTMAKIAFANDQSYYCCSECDGPLVQYAPNSEVWVCHPCKLFWTSEQGEAELTSVAEKAGMELEPFMAVLTKIARAKDR